MAYKCMNAVSNQSPKASEISEIIDFWNSSFHDNKYYQENEKYGYKGKEIKVIFEEADKEVPNISTSYKKDPDAIYTSRLFSDYLHNRDSQLVDLEVSNSILQSEDDIDENSIDN
ncbi:unnamed protein product [Rhizophagus irregularis]|nr:unnamed protein product [Rhizophagus irregularis]